MIPLAGFLPDIDPTTPGVITSVTNLVPTQRGYAGAPTMQAASMPVLSATCVGAALATKLDATTRLFAATDTKIYEASGGAWVDRSRAGNYTSGDKYVRFAQFGDVTLATNKLDTLQASSGAAFSDLATAPKARLMDVSQGFVMLADTNDATYGDQSDRWWCSGIYDHTVWTPAVATQATTGRLVDVPGPIRAMKALGAYFVAYKDRGIFVGSYVGTPIVWSWTLLPGEIGCPSNESVVKIGSAHIFISFDNIYMFDGTRPQPIGDGVKTWFFNDLNKSYRHKVLGVHDKINSRVWFFYPRNDSAAGSPNAALIYNYQTGKWGWTSMSVESVCEFVSSPFSFDSLTGTFDTFTPDLPFDSPYWTSTSPTPAVFDTSHQISLLAGVSSSSSMTMGDVGDDARYSTLRRVRARFVTAPTSANMTNNYKATEGASLTVGSTVSMSDGKFDVLRSSRFHRCTINFVGDHEIMGVDYDLQPDGLR